MAAKTDRYIEAVGRRKEATARVRLTPAGKTQVVVNGKALNDYFKTESARVVAKTPFDKTEDKVKYAVSAKVVGGGASAQAGAISLGIARALVKADEDNKKPLRDNKLLTRDAREKERRHFGKAGKARKSKQWSKR